jgi:hypothetical protein
MIDLSFSRCNVSSLPEWEECSESMEEIEDVTLRAGRPGDTGREEASAVVRRWNEVGFGRSSGGVESGDESAGDCATRSSASDVWPLSRDAAKLLEISGSDTNA